MVPKGLPRTDGREGPPRSDGPRRTARSDGPERTARSDGLVDREVCAPQAKLQPRAAAAVAAAARDVLGGAPRAGTCRHHEAYLVTPQHVLPQPPAAQLQPEAREVFAAAGQLGAAEVGRLERRRGEGHPGTPTSREASGSGASTTAPAAHAGDSSSAAWRNPGGEGRSGGQPAASSCSAPGKLSASIRTAAAAKRAASERVASERAANRAATDRAAASRAAANRAAADRAVANGAAAEGALPGRRLQVQALSTAKPQARYLATT